MSKNYKIGSKFRVTSNSTNGFNVGDIVNLVARRVDGLFEMDNGEFQQALYEDQFELVCEPLSQKLKPAKQSLADAIHQNGGWPERALWAVQDNCIAFFLGGKPEYKSGDRCWYSNSIDGACVGTITRDEKVTNWHQTILSRDEYFTAYPEQVKVEICNETKHKVEVEMESESEATINASDWHKNGELPPVGEVCEVMHLDRWVCCEVIAHFEQSWGMVAAYTVGINGGNAKLLEQCNAEDFRPLRTERERAIDEMVVCLAERWANCEELAAHLYDAGYRKEVKQ